MELSHYCSGMSFSDRLFVDISIQPFSIFGYELHYDRIKHAGSWGIITPYAPIRMGSIGDCRTLVIILTCASRRNYDYTTKCTRFTI